MALSGNHQSLGTEKQGYAFAIAAFIMWGVAPLYFKALIDIDAVEILMHRVVWSFLFLLVIILLIKQWHTVTQVLRKPKLMLMLAVTASLLGFNWGLFIWSVNNDHILDASLGYYINPLLNVLLGMLFLKERLRTWQKWSVVLAFTGVILQVISFGSFPTIAFALAGSFAIYGLLRKKMPVASFPGLLLESLMMMPVALIYWVWFLDSATADMALNSLSLNILFISAGVVTTLPLLCFTAAAKRLPYSTLGFFQYIGPSLMFAIAVTFYGETFDIERGVTFGFIWLALILFSADSILAARKQSK